MKGMPMQHGCWTSIDEALGQDFRVQGQIKP